MNINLDRIKLDENDKKEIERLLKLQHPDIKDDLDQMWYLLDLVWEELGCDNKNLDWEKIGKYYSHPVWLLNGLFVEEHQESQKHRNIISDWVIEQNFTKVIDYGGGFGTLARLIAKKNPELNVYLYEPYPSKYTFEINKEYNNLQIIGNLGQEKFDCLISTDVLEHVDEPLKVLEEMIDHVQDNGYLVLAVAFSPLIKCHLPKHFHFKYTFPFFARLYGIKKERQLEGSHAFVYKKIRNKKPNKFLVKLSIGLSKFIYQGIKIVKRIIGK